MLVVPKTTYIYTQAQILLATRAKPSRGTFLVLLVKIESDECRNSFVGYASHLDRDRDRAQK